LTAETWKTVASWVCSVIFGRFYWFRTWPRDPISKQRLK